MDEFFIMYNFAFFEDYIFFWCTVTLCEGNIISQKCGCWCCWSVCPRLVASNAFLHTTLFLTNKPHLSTWRKKTVRRDMHSYHSFLNTETLGRARSWPKSSDFSLTLILSIVCPLNRLNERQNKPCRLAGLQLLSNGLLQRSVAGVFEKNTRRS